MCPCSDSTTSSPLKKKFRRTACSFQGEHQNVAPGQIALVRLPTAPKPRKATSMCWRDWITPRTLAISRSRSTAQRANEGPTIRTTSTIASTDNRRNGQSQTTEGRPLETCEKLLPRRPPARPSE